MSALIATDKVTVIFGLGQTGLSVARYLTKRGQSFVVVDTRENPPGLAALRKLNSDVLVYAGEITERVENVILNAAEIIISPGISRETSVVVKAIELGVSVVGDIALFLREAKAPVIGITGSNGKTTVTTLVGLVAEKANINACVAGNIGVPALDVLADNVELYILELSSFQLESIPKASLAVACNLNISEDHMDRYTSLASYCMAKQRIFWGAKKVIYNLDDKLTQPPVLANVKRYGFGLNISTEQGDKKYLYNSDNKFLCISDDPIMAAGELKIFGRHNIANALAVLAICDAAGIDQKAVVDTLKIFSGLPHRCQWVAEKNGITFINDSKATNVGAAVAAIEGLCDDFNSLTLIAGGDGKGANFKDLGEVINKRVDKLILIGRDAAQLADSVLAPIDIIFAETLERAVDLAFEKTQNNGVVLLSPACASFDMFNSFEHRGECFIQAVEGLAA